MTAPTPDPTAPHPEGSIDATLTGPVPDVETHLADASTMAATIGGFCSSARATPKTVRGSPTSSNASITRQKPARLPYS